ncbi:MAG: CoB--CoM heterodisulfide reductase iron-sulfur subunit A family protein [Syntrophobacteraceae bacterium]|nr:CoB--CoM heterodisulfide reductase iron-sulfur subunit A family protein [Syntrophobacteraceae bacterium]
MSENSQVKSPTGAVMVVGGGIAGTQAALDLAGSGFFVYVVESSPTIGGVMAQLDKTFPTNDCSMCILSPKLVECGRHLNIRLMTMSEVEKVEGEAGSFVVTVREKPRFVDAEKCVACGICAEKCPKKVKDSFNEGLGVRKAAYVKYPQAVPLKYLLDDENCIFFKNGKCRACEKFCPTGAIDFDQKEKEHRIEVGAVVLAPGFKSFDPTPLDTYGYGKYPNVISSLEFERILSASGPFEGHLERPSDRKAPRKIAWLQCVGSRDSHECAHGYCSGVCCMYAIKEAVIAKEHAKESLDTAIFFMDMRTYGKDFERYYDRAREETGVRFIRSRVHTIAPAAPGSDDLAIEYVDDSGTQRVEVFDLVVLSTGLEVSDEAKGLAQRIGIELDSGGFAQTNSFSPISASRPGIFVCGAFSGPKDIPSSVMEASAASAASAALLSGSRNALTQSKTYPPEDPSVHAEPRVGVFVCRCGVNIASVVDVPAVRDYARGLPNVAYVAENMFTCSQDTQKLIIDGIKEHRLNRIVVAACTPRTHEPLFQETIREAGLNAYLFEFANIRDQDSWVHQAEPEKATAKAKDLVRMAVAKAALLEPIEKLQAPLIQSALVIGGGVAGMNAAINLSAQGFKTYLVEKKPELGGHALEVGRTWKGEDVFAYVEELKTKVTGDPNIEVFTGADLVDAGGFVGQFTSIVKAGGQEKEIKHGAVILATGAEPFEPVEYLYGQTERVTRWHDLEKLFRDDPKKLDAAEGVAFIQCVGSREPERPYCSKLCCTSAIRQAIDLKEKKPDLDVYVLYRDIRTYGQREELYTQARGLGVLFIRYNPEEKPVVSKISANGSEKLKIRVRDHVLGFPVELTVDYLNLSTAIVPRGLNELARFFKVPLNQDGFFLEAHMKLRPVDFATDGVFVAGLAHYPKPLDESVAQAGAAAARAASVLAKPWVEVEPIVSAVNQELCIGCGMCEANCPFGAIRLHEEKGKGYRAETISASCKGCGVCAASCPQKAIDMKHFRDSQIIAAIRSGGSRN